MGGPSELGKLLELPVVDSALDPCLGGRRPLGNLWSWRGSAMKMHGLSASAQAEPPTRTDA